MKRIMRSIITLGVLATSPGMAGTSAADGSFGENGKVVEMLSEQGHSWFGSLLPLPNGKILAGGDARDEDGVDLMTVYRYLPNGKRDPKWGKNGLSTADFIYRIEGKNFSYDFKEGGDLLRTLMRQSDGKIVAGSELIEWGSYGLHDNYQGAFRLKNNGKIDRKFGPIGNGFTFTSRGNGGDEMVTAARQADDKIVTLGWHYLYDGRAKGATHVCRFDKNGRLDPLFGDRGCKEFFDPEVTEYFEKPTDMIIQSDGKILVVGEGYDQGCGEDQESYFTRGFMTRLENNGSIDTRFGDHGFVKIDSSAIFDIDYPCSGNVAISVAQQKDGKLVVLGQGFNAHYEFYLARYNPDGTLDKSFGYGGMIAIFSDKNYVEWKGADTTFRPAFGAPRYKAKRVKIRSNGKIVVSGFTYYSCWTCYDQYFFVAQFTPDGKRDWDFANGGFAVASVNYIGDTTDWADAPAAAIQKDDKVLVGGWSRGDDTPQHAWLIRFRDNVRPKDYDGKQGADILWKRKDGKHLVWYMDKKAKKRSTKFLGAKGYKYRASGDFNGDGISDILWQSKSDPAKHIIWYMKANHKKRARTLRTPGLNAVAAGDFNGDGTSDILFSDGRSHVVWLMGQKGTIGTRQLNDANVSIIATGDFNRDFITDVLIRYMRGDDTGDYAIWTMDRNATIASTYHIGWEEKEVKGVGDFDGDGRDDIVWRLPDRSYELDTAVYCCRTENIGAENLILESVGDYNGDGFADILWKRKNGKHLIWLMSPWPDGELHKIKTRKLSAPTSWKAQK